MAARRPWLAAVLAVLYPGLGHVYLREWLRALLWFFLAISTAMLVVPETALQGGGLEAIVQAQSDLPPSALGALVAVTLFSVVDAYWLASRDDGPDVVETDSADAGGRDGDGVSCPNCRRTVTEAEYGFCPWCAAELDSGGRARDDGDAGNAGPNL
jgi:hypothetical protein